MSRETVWYVRMTDGESLWARVCATVNRLGGARASRPAVMPVQAPKTILDLHGMTVGEAHRSVGNFLSSAVGEVLIITGRSGCINAEFLFWMEDFPILSIMEQNDGGAFLIKMKKKSQP